ncbi:MAG: oligosaccharide flippase family protein [Bacteroidota bacterium]|nr:oligosaccharide flippase family protein [Bacteroidota bacterium]
MLTKLKLKSEFSRNILTLMTGTVIAQAIPIGISPILTRMYTPEDFGVFAVYMSIVSIIAAFVTGRYELAIMLPKKDEDAINILTLSVIITFFVSISILLIVLIFNLEITNFLGNSEISSWLYFIPLSVFLTGIYQSFNYWSNRKKQYKLLATSRVIQSTATATSNLSMGFNGLGTSGLIVGGVIGQSLATSVLGKMIWDEGKNHLANVNKLKIFALGKKYSKFPKYDLSAYVAYSIYSNFAAIFFNKFFESSVSGFYFFANKLLKTPFSFFISAFSDVFYQKLSQSKTNEAISNEVNYYSLKIFKITIIPFIVVVYSSFYYVEFIFGEEWKELYKYIYIFSLPIYIGLLLSPYRHILKIINRQEISMYLHIFRLVILGIFLISYFYIDYDLMWFLYLYAFIDTIIHLFLRVSVDYLIKNNYIMNFYRIAAIILGIGLLNFKLVI